MHLPHQSGEEGAKDRCGEDLNPITYRHACKANSDMGPLEPMVAVDLVHY